MVGGWRFGSGRPGGASRSDQLAGCRARDGHVDQPSCDGSPTQLLGIAEHTTAPLRGGSRPAVRFRRAVRRGHPRIDPGPVRPDRRHARGRPRSRARCAHHRLRRTPEIVPEPTLAILDRLPSASACASTSATRRTSWSSASTTCSTARPAFADHRAAEFHDVRNSLLDLVRERRIGLPISLAIVELEVAERIGLAMHGIGLPGHFICRPGDGMLIDPAAAAGASARRLPGADPTGRRGGRAVPHRHAPTGPGARS